MGKSEISKQSMYQKIMPTMNQKREVEPVVFEEQPPHLVTNTKQQTSNCTMVNLAQRAIEARLEEALAKFNCCQCEKCLFDIQAIALNSLPVKYVVGNDADINTKLQQYQESVVPALVKAIMIVKNNPRHG